MIAVSIQMIAVHSIYVLFLCFREIVETMVQAYSAKIFHGEKPVFDGRKNLYSRMLLPFDRERVSPATDSFLTNIIIILPL